MTRSVQSLTSFSCLRKSASCTDCMRKAWWGGVVSQARQTLSLGSLATRDCSLGWEGEGKRSPSIDSKVFYTCLWSIACGLISDLLHILTFVSRLHGRHNWQRECSQLLCSTLPDYQRPEHHLHLYLHPQWVPFSERLRARLSEHIAPYDQWS